MSGVHRDTLVEAAKRGRIVVWPAANELFVDLDSEWARERFEERLALLEKSLGQRWITVVRSSATAGHYHATVTMHRDVRSEHERIALQSILGSDANRELFSWVRHEIDARPVSCFFEPVPVMHANVMDAPDGPRCACGLPSAREDGSCAVCVELTPMRPSAAVPPPLTFGEDGYGYMGGSR